MTRLWHKLFHKVIHHPRLVIAITLVGCMAAAMPLNGLKIDPSVDALIDPESTVADDLLHFQSVFGNDELVIVAFAWPDVLSENFLKFVGEFTEDLKTDPAVSSVDSLSHAVRVRASGEELKVSELFRPMPKTPKQLEMRRIEAVNNKLYSGDLLNKELNASSVLIRLKSVPELEGQAGAVMEDLDPELQAQLAAQKPNAGKIRSALVESLSDRIQKAAAANFENQTPEFHTAGFFITSKAVEASIIRDNSIFLPATIGTIILLLFIAFRNFSGITLPLTLVVLTLFPTIGLMSLTGIPLTMVNSFLPVVLMIIALADAIHILVKYYEESGKSDVKLEALEKALQKIYKPCLFTSITTIVGFLSLSYTDIPPVRHFGWFAAVGVVVAFTLTVTFLPAVLALLPKPTAKNNAVLAGDWMSGILDWACRVGRQNQVAIFVVALMLMAGAIGGLGYINIETVMTKFYRTDSKLVQDLLFIDDRLAGTQTLEILLEGLDKKGRNYSHIQDPAKKQKSYDQTKDTFLSAGLQKKIDQFEAFLLEDPYIKKVLSITDLTRTTKAAFKEPSSEKIALPDKTDDIANYMFLLSSSADPSLIKTFTTPGYTKARLMVRMRNTGTATLRRSLERIQTKEDFFGPDIKMIITGTTVMSAAIADNFLENQIVSFGLALLSVIIIIGLIYQSVTIGALALIPNLFPILMGFLTMFLLDIDLNVNTVMVASIAIGLVVDDTIHFFHRLIMENKTKSPEEAIDTSIKTVGRALGFTSFVLVGGFVILVASDFQGTAWLGLLLATVILWALLADLVLTPIVVRLFRPSYFYDDNRHSGRKSGGEQVTGSPAGPAAGKTKPVLSTPTGPAATPADKKQNGHSVNISGVLPE